MQVKLMKRASRNPNGRPNLREASSQQLRDAIKRGARRHGNRSLIRHLVDQAYKDNTVLIAIARKILPDLKAIDISATSDSPFRLIIDLTAKGKANKTTKGGVKGVKSDV